MKYISLLLLAATVVADKLDNTYLPPNRAQTAGGSGYFLKAPVGSIPRDSKPPSTLYGTPVGGINIASSKVNTGPASPPIAILKFNNDNNGDGKYSFDFETENHITQQEIGQLKSDEILAAQGSYSFQAPDGQIYTVNYIADENGFQVQGDHIPTAPPVPEEIAKALEQNAAEEAKGIYDDGQYRPDPSEGYSGNKYLAPKTVPAPSSSNGGYRY